MQIDGSLIWNRPDFFGEHTKCNNDEYICFKRFQVTASPSLTMTFMSNPGIGDNR